MKLMKKFRKKRNKLTFKEDEIFPLFNNKIFRKKEKKNNNYNNKSICYFLICIFFLFIAIIFLILFNITYFFINKEYKRKLISVFKSNENITKEFNKSTYFSNLFNKNESNITTTKSTELNHIMMYYNSDHMNRTLSNNSNTTILLIGIAKFENNYIREWVEHYKRIGITKIILCDNNPINEEKLSEPIKDYVDSNFVEVDESYRGKSHLQLNCYKKHFQNSHMDYDWIAINDIDEFIFLEEGSGYTNIQQFLDEPIFNDTDNIVLTWKYYDDNDILDVVDGDYSVLKRFTRHISFKNKTDPNSLSKSIYKGKVERNYMLGGHCIQGFKDKSGREYVFRTADGEIMKFKKSGWCFYNFKHTHFPVSIHHFQLKSIGEYIKSKMLKFEKSESQKYTFKFFFDINKLTKEKVKYVFKILNKDKLKTKQYNIDNYINKTIEI